jgi:hypothetical protein
LGFGDEKVVILTSDFGLLLTLGYLDRSSGDSNEGFLSSFLNGLTPDAAVDEVQRVKDGDRCIDRIIVTTDLELDLFCSRHRVTHPCFLGLFLTPKNQRPVCLHGKTGRH